MSGPITAGYILATGTLMLAEEAIRQARDMKREYGEVLEQLRSQQDAIARNRDARDAARLDSAQALKRHVESAIARVERLRVLAAPLGDVTHVAASAAPSESSEDALRAYVQALESEAAALHAFIATSAGGSADLARASLAAAGPTPTLDEVLAAYAMQRSRAAGLNAADLERFTTTAGRILGRLGRSDGAPIPPDLEALAREIVIAPSVERAEALTSELRLAVQRRRDTADGERFEAEQRAAAYVLQESLRDLGYEVEDIDATLFVGGGTTHFRRAGWDNYHVRMRIDPVERTMNFNVVRARGDEESAERRRLDALAEDRWCAEFPRLLQTLQARGITLDVTRRLDAGEVPVQVVDASALPAARGETEAETHRRSPLARRTP